MSNWLQDTLGWGSDTQADVLASVLVIALLLTGRWLVVRALHGRVEDTEVLFRSRKAATYTTTVLLVAFLGWIWVDAFQGFATFLGLLSAGIAIALSDVLKNLAGWVYIVTRRPFKVGDRIQLGDNSGDVIDIRAFRFSMLEIGNWVDADQSTGRIIHVPNGLVFTNATANYTEGFPFVWEEIPVQITFESDWERAEEILQHVLVAHAPDALEAGAAADIRRAARQYLIKYTALTPITYVSVRDSGVLITGRVLVRARSRRGVTSDIWKAVLRQFGAEPNVELAYPTTRTYLHDPVRVERADS